MYRNVQLTNGSCFFSKRLQPVPKKRPTAGRPWHSFDRTAAVNGNLPVEFPVEEDRLDASLESTLRKEPADCSSSLHGTAVGPGCQAYETHEARLGPCTR